MFVINIIIFKVILIMFVVNVIIFEAIIIMFIVNTISFIENVVAPLPSKPLLYALTSEVNDGRSWPMHMPTPKLRPTGAPKGLVGKVVAPYPHNDDLILPAAGIVIFGN